VLTEDIPTHKLKREESKQGGTSSSAKQVDKKATISIELASFVLRCILESRRKDGESSLSECTISKDTTGVDVKNSKIN